MRTLPLALLALIPALALGWAGCTATRIPAPPPDARAILLDTGMDSQDTYAAAFAAFAEAGWEPETAGTFGFRCRPDGTEGEVAVRVVEAADDARIEAVILTPEVERLGVLQRAARILRVVPGVMSYE